MMTASKLSEPRIRSLQDMSRFASHASFVSEGRISILRPSAISITHRSSVEAVGGYVSPFF